jgi:hypothetical protein
MAASPEAAPVRLKAWDCLTPFGGADATHAALLRGERALAPVPVHGREGGDPVPLALLPGRALDETVPPAWLPALGHMLAPVCGRPWGSPKRPVCFASSNFGVGSLYAFRRTGDTAHAVFGTPHASVDTVRRRLGWGPNVAVFSHACVSAHLGLHHAARLLASGAAEEVLVVSYDFLSPFVAGGFHALKILNTGFPAPYTARAAGAIGLGDGAAYAVLARENGALGIGAHVLHNEMHHFTGNRPDGTGFDACLAPLAAASRGRRVWFKGHGTGTLEAGRLEAEAVVRAFPGAPLVGWKGSLGHTLGSCGLVELAIAATSLRAGRTPGTVGSGTPAMIDLVARDPFANGGFDAAVCASNAFGGAHAALLLHHV